MLCEKNDFGLPASSTDKKLIRGELQPAASAKLPLQACRAQFKGMRNSAVRLVAYNLGFRLRFAFRNVAVAAVGDASGTHCP